MKTILVLQGGGPLGAFECGAWQVLAPWLRESGHVLTAVAGTSIGALNAALIARHAGRGDWGAQALHGLWARRIAEPEAGPALRWPWTGPQRDEIEAWLGCLHGLLLGNRALFRPLWAHWNPVAALHRLEMPLYSQAPMQDLLRDIVGDEGYRSLQPDEPLLAVGATEVLGGALRLFTSDEQAIDDSRLSASAAMPLMFAPLTIDGQLYWDGEVNRAAIAPALWQHLIERGLLAAEEPLQWITIETFSRQGGRPPLSGQEILDRALHLLLGGKPGAATPPAPQARHLVIAYRPSPHDHVSGQFDHSARRISALIEAGRQSAWRGLQQRYAAPRAPQLPHTGAGGSAGHTPMKEITMNEQNRNASGQRQDETHPQQQEQQAQREQQGNQRDPQNQREQQGSREQQQAGQGEENRRSDGQRQQQR